MRFPHLRGLCVGTALCRGGRWPPTGRSSACTPRAGSQRLLRSLPSAARVRGRPAGKPLLWISLHFASLLFAPNSADGAVERNVQFQNR